ncbi:hypothetical protein A2U01_0095549, partial [Trifolium medium]|nr:hypothetical protein [Trifolium medium]
MMRNLNRFEMITKGRRKPHRGGNGGET